jgi:hypothetical protein
VILCAGADSLKLALALAERALRARLAFVRVLPTCYSTFTRGSLGILERCARRAECRRLANGRRLINPGADKSFFSGAKIS